MIELTRVVTTHPERGADDDADRQGQRVGLGQERPEAAHGGRSLSARRPSACSWPRRSSRRPRSPTVPGGPCSGAPHRLPGRSLAGSPRCAVPARRVNRPRRPRAGPEYSEPTPLMRIRSTRLTHLRMSTELSPVAFSIAARPPGLAPISRSASAVAIPASASFSASIGPMPSTSSIFMLVPPSSRRARAALGGTDDTLADQPATRPGRTRRTHGSGVPRRDGGRLRAQRAGPRSSAARCTMASS